MNRKDIISTAKQILGLEARGDFSESRNQKVRELAGEITHWKPSGHRVYLTPSGRYSRRLTTAIDKWAAAE